MSPFHRFMTLAIAFAALAAALGAARAEGPLPRGPEFGNNRFRTRLDAGDADDYVAPLIRGETLSVAVSADRGLTPVLTLVDPGGVARSPAVATSRGGSTVRARVPIDVTGRWTVRIAAPPESAGAYSARFSVRAAPPLVLRGLRLGDGAPAEREHAFEAVAGARLVARLVHGRRRNAAAVASVAAPDGSAVDGAVVRRRGRVETCEALLDGTGDGAYLLTVAAEEGSAEYDLTLAVHPPPRPRGTTTLSPDEPRLTPFGAPLQGSASQGLRLTGANFSPGVKPEVWFGDRRAGVLLVGPSGTWMDVAPPAHPQGARVDVAVVNPDGQAVVAPAYFEYTEPEVPRLAALSPATASVYEAGVLRFRLTLTRAAPPAGLVVAVSAPAELGSVPAEAHFGGGATEATFELRAQGLPATGRVEARHDDVALHADVAIVSRPTVDPDEPPPPLPDEVDISGWSLHQTTSARRFTFPAGTVLRQGDYVLVARASTRAAFETYWKTSLGSSVHYFTNDPTNTSAAGDDWPSINGDETFELRDAADRPVDGPTVAMQAGGLANYQRVVGTPAGQSASWSWSTLLTPGTAPTPGFGQPASSAKHGVRISEFSDASSGTGQYAFEFVELHFDGNP